MRLTFKLIIIILFNLSFSQYAFSDNHNIYETLEIIKNDLKTLERAVYSGSIEIKAENNETSNTELDSNSEDVLTRHLLKLSEVEDQFRQLTNKFEEINFKLDKLSNRLSKIQADNQIRFQDIETVMNSGEVTAKLSSKPKIETDKILPGSSQPQDLGSISYKDTETNEATQKIEYSDYYANLDALLWTRDVNIVQKTQEEIDQYQKNLLQQQKEKAFQDAIQIGYLIPNTQIYLGLGDKDRAAWSQLITLINDSSLIFILFLFSLTIQRYNINFFLPNLFVTISVYVYDISKTGNAIWRQIKILNRCLFTYQFLFVL